MAEQYNELETTLVEEKKKKVKNNSSKLNQFCYQNHHMGTEALVPKQVVMQNGDRD